MLFAAFEKHQYYNVKDLVRITNQPIVRKKIYFLREMTLYFLETRKLIHLLMIFAGLPQRSLKGGVQLLR
jgi:hypothetical protein